MILGRFKRHWSHLIHSKGVYKTSKIWFIRWKKRNWIYREWIMIRWSEKDITSLSILCYKLWIRPNNEQETVYYLHCLYKRDGLLINMNYLKWMLEIHFSPIFSFCKLRERICKWTNHCKRHRSFCKSIHQGSYLKYICLTCSFRKLVHKWFGRQQWSIWRYHCSKKGQKCHP